MSRPRAATSEAIISGTSPSLNFCSASRRADCVMSPCSATALKSCRFSDVTSVLMSRLRLQKITAFFTSSLFSSPRSASRLPFGAVQVRCWATVSAVLAGGATSMTLGFETNLSLRVLISSDRVAEKNSVWRSGGSRPTMRSTSGIKPISSIRSASSMTRIFTSVSSTLPRSKWSSSRPGVAISTSTPLSRAAFWSAKLTPPIRSAIDSL